VDPVDLFVKAVTRSTFSISFYFVLLSLCCSVFSQGIDGKDPSINLNPKNWRNRKYVCLGRPLKQPTVLATSLVFVGAYVFLLYYDPNSYTKRKLTTNERSETRRPYGSLPPSINTSCKPREYLVLHILWLLPVSTLIWAIQVKWRDRIKPSYSSSPTTTHMQFRSSIFFNCGIKSIIF
jgi:hypothetical protein